MEQNCQTKKHKWSNTDQRNKQNGATLPSQRNTNAATLKK